MNNKHLTRFWATVIASGLMGFLLSTISVKANFLDDLFNFIKPESSVQNQIKKTEGTKSSYEAPVDYEQAVINAVEKGAPGVISIIISKDLPIIENCPYSPFSNLPPEFQQFFGPIQLEQPCQKGTKKQEVGGGSGFIVSPDGIIVTNKHVVADTKAEYTVLTNDGKKFAAKVLARDPVQDLAIVKITPTGPLATLKLGDSDGVKLAQTAIAIGNALGEFRNTVSVGIVSGLARAISASGAGGSDVERLEGLIQTDAAINPGNSGGPLLNLKGEVIGINTAIAQGAENIGFAIPINKVKHDIESVKKSGKITVAFLGVRYIPVTEELKEKEKLSVDYGVLVRGNADGPAVIKESPAEKAGLRAEDIILSVNGEKITDQSSLSSFIQKYNVGDTIALKILRDAKELVISVVLGEREF